VSTWNLEVASQNIALFTSAKFHMCTVRSSTSLICQLKWHQWACGDLLACRSHLTA
jgi:hypothetical protein